MAVYWPEGRDNPVSAHANANKEAEAGRRAKAEEMGYANCGADGGDCIAEEGKDLQACAIIEITKQEQRDKEAKSHPAESRDY
jgi:hypothetical protein